MISIPNNSIIIKIIDDYISSISLATLLARPQFILPIDSIKSTRPPHLYNIGSNIIDGMDFDSNILDNSKAQITTEIQVFDQKKKLLDFMTDLISKEVVFNDKNQREIFNFQYLVNNFFNFKIEEYIQNFRSPTNSMFRLQPNSIFFMYKGGTTMQIIYQKYKTLLQSKFIDDNQDYFKRSDSDYAIVINKEIIKDEKLYFILYYEMNILCYNILQRIKDFLNDKTYINDIIPLDNVNPDALLKILCDANKILSNKKLTYFANVDKFIGITFNKKTTMTEPIGIITDVYNLDSIDDIIEDNFIMVTKDGLFNQANSFEFVKGVESPRKSFEFVEHRLERPDKLVKQTSDDFVLVDDDDDDYELVPKALKLVKPKASDKETTLQRETKNNFFIRNKYVPSVKKDFYITIKQKNSNEYNPKVIPLTNNENQYGIYNYFNETNRFTTTDAITNFTLHRVKINSVFYFKTKDGKYGFINIPSELIDVPITKFDDDKSNHLHYDHEIKKYENIYIDHRLEYTSYNLYGYIHDILASFTNIDYPWSDKKYDKKIIRVTLLLCFIGYNKYININEIVTQIITQINTKQNIVNPNFQLKYMILHEPNPFVEFIKLLNDTKLKSIDPTNAHKFNGMCNIIVKIFSEFKKYLDINPLRIETGFTTNPEQVPYLQKYLLAQQEIKILQNKIKKYKTKYINLKENKLI